MVGAGFYLNMFSLELFGSYKIIYTLGVLHINNWGYSFLGNVMQTDERVKLFSFVVLLLD